MGAPRYPLLSIARLRMGIDGAGVNTLVGGAGCPLRCRWCINKKLLDEASAEMISAEELFDRVKIDDLYFRATGGGVTFGGGEALLYAVFIRRFRALCPEEWMIRAETSLAVSPALVRTAAGAVDEFIVDCKDTDEAVYRAYTGGDGNLMWENLRLLCSLVAPERILVRVPLIPGYNTPAHQARSVDHLKKLGLTRFDLFSYVVRE
ncbi:MAG: radical SAM protein [Oscillospiraceae bacterium]|nr:radical SAM protein [Oscillospiraceae bacterium]